MHIKRRLKEDADLDITSFMNLMIILVPVLLMSMVLSRTAILDLKLPDVKNSSADPMQTAAQHVELIIRASRFEVNYPAGVKLQWINKTPNSQYDFDSLSLALQETKRLLEDRGIKKNDIFILSEKNIDYQTLITAMDSVRSYKAVVAAHVVDAELFPEISLGDAPILVKKTSVLVPGTQGEYE